MREFFVSVLIICFLFLFYSGLAGAYAVEVDLKNSEMLLNKKPSIGLVLSGGGARGFAHIGVLKIIEKAGIKPDYIAGTSMGAVIGAMYSLGYTAKEIEKLICSQDWEFIISNKIKYKNMSMSYKEDYERYFMKFSFKNGHFKLPSALIEGQHIAEMINYYITWKAFKVKDFTNLPVPFFCIAINLENGKERVFKNGYLPDAVMASIAIPSLFSPVYIDGIPYIDGGLKDNFPVEKMKEIFNPDIIIGSFVGFESKSKDDFNSLNNVLTQSMFLSSFNLLESNKKKCDILVEPKVYDYSPFSFSNYIEIIKKGEEAALKKWDSFVKLKNNLTQFLGDNVKVENKLFPKMEIKFDSIKIKGLKRLNRNFVLKYINFEEGRTYTKEEIADKISCLYGTGYFLYVNYKIISEDDKQILILMLKEKNEKILKVGMRYDTDYLVSLLFNYKSNGFLIKNDVLDIKSQISQNPFLGIKYEIYPFVSSRSCCKRYLVSPGIGLFFNIANMDIDIYDPEYNVKYYSFDYIVVNFGTFLKYELSNTFLLGIITGINYSIIKDDELNQIVFQLGPNIKIDSRDSSEFTNKGMFFDLKLRYLFDFNPEYTFEGKNYPHSFVGKIIINGYIPIFKKLVLESGVKLGISDGMNIPISYYFFLGGFRKYYLFGSMPLSLMHSFDMFGAFAIGEEVGLRYHIIKKGYITVFTNAGYTSNTIDNLFDIFEYPFGIGLKFSYESIIGPLEASIVYSSFIRGVLFYLNIGFSL